MISPLTLLSDLRYLSSSFLFGTFLLLPFQNREWRKTCRCRCTPSFLLKRLLFSIFFIFLPNFVLAFSSSLVFYAYNAVSWGHGAPSAEAKRLPLFAAIGFNAMFFSFSPPPLFPFSYSRLFSFCPQTLQAVFSLAKKQKKLSHPTGLLWVDELFGEFPPTRTALCVRRARFSFLFGTKSPFSSPG